MQVHGFNTQGENIADNGGLRAALNAYSLLARRQPATRRDTLPGLPQYKPDQLFFLGFAQVWLPGRDKAAHCIAITDIF